MHRLVKCPRFGKGLDIVRKRGGGVGKDAALSKMSTIWEGG